MRARSVVKCVYEKVSLSHKQIKYDASGLASAERLAISSMAREVLEIYAANPFAKV